MMYVEIDTVQDRYDCFIAIQMMKCCSNFLLPLTIIKNLKPYFKNSSRTKSLTLRKAITDKTNTYTIVSMIMSNINLNFHLGTLYRNEYPKSLTRYRFDKTKERTTFKSAVPRPFVFFS